MNITYETAIECLPETISIEENASAIGEEIDAEIVSDIRAQLESGNDWAWCCVRVKVTAYDSEGEQITYGDDYLGACSYASEADFRACPYFEDMESTARKECDREIVRLRAALA
jgi:hypothetical protein